MDRAVRDRIFALIDEGWEVWAQFDDEVRRNSWHPFVAGDYEMVLEALIPLYEPGLRFLEWGSATGVVAIIADLLGFESYGIELDARLVDHARRLAMKYQSRARFAQGSFLPTGYQWRPESKDGRLGTIGVGPAGYDQLGHELEDFDIVYAYPWGGEEPLMRDLLRERGRKGARLLLHGDNDVRVY